MKRPLLLLFIGMLVFAWQQAQAQDLIYKKNKEVILAKIIEMGTDEVKYKEYNSTSDVVFSIAKSELWKVKFENGKEQYFMDDFTNPNMYADNKKNALKVDFFAPLYYKFTVGYERSVKPGMSYEATLGIIGIGYNPYNTDEDLYYSSKTKVNTSGAFGRFGIKFIRTPDFYVKGQRYAHILKGSYIKPEITFGSYAERIERTNIAYGPTPVYTVDKVKRDVVFGAFMINMGKQWIFNDIFLLDYFVGLGYCFDNKTKSSSNNSIYDPVDMRYNNYALIKFGEKTPFSINAGVKIGILLK